MFNALLTNPIFYKRLNKDTTETLLKLSLHLLFHGNNIPEGIYSKHTTSPVCVGISLNISTP